MPRSSSRIARSPFHGSMPANPTNRSGFAVQVAARVSFGYGSMPVVVSASAPEQHAHQAEASEPLGHRVVGLSERTAPRKKRS